MRFSKTTLGALLLAGCATQAYHYSGHSFFSVRTPFQSGSPEKEALWHYDWLDRADQGICGTFEVVPFGGRTIGCNDELGHFFAPYGRTRLTVEEYKPSVASSTSDLNRIKQIEARHLNIQTSSATETFSSVITFDPVHEFAGVGLAWRQRINDCWWFEFAAPIEKVTNRIDVCEKVITTGGGAVDALGLEGLPRVGTVTESLFSPLWRFGRIEPGVKHTKWGVADLEIKVGWETYKSEGAHFRSFFGLVVPTGNKPDPRFLFPPVVGNNKHVGVLFGSNIGFCVWECNDHRFRQEIDVVGRYLFPNHQCRSFDVQGKEWSRYQEMYLNQAQAAAAFDATTANTGIAGINAFTQNVRVEPRFQTVFNTALLYSYCDAWRAEVGYNFYVRQGERIKFDGCDRQSAAGTDRAAVGTAALKHVNGNGQTSLSRTLRFNFADDAISLANYTPVVTLLPIDTNSAAHPPVIGQTFYGSLGYECLEWSYPTLFSVGGSYEFSHSNGGLRKWMAWGKIAVSF